MFSSYPFRQLTCSSSSPPPTATATSFVLVPCVSHDNSDEDSLFLNPANALIAPCPFIIEKYAPCPTTSNNKAAIANPVHSDSVMAAKKSRARKGGHSKIFTGQGLRDRRVRLSIKIARKFFNLQDKLGFDRPSKTLSWLFTNSKLAIQELVEEMSTNYNLINSSSSFELDMVLTGRSNGSAVGAQDQEVVISKQNPAVRIGIGIGSRGGKEKKINKSALHDYFVTKSKESREKARARARERTLEKQRIREFNSQFPDPSSSSNSLLKGKGEPWL